MNVYLLTESDLDRLGDLNTNAAFFTAAATFFGGYSMDLYKDQALAENIPAATQTALSYLQPLLFVVTAGFALMAIIYWVKRGSHKARIKRDSKSKSKLTGQVRPASDGDGGA